VLSVLLRTISTTQAFFYHFAFGSMELSDSHIHGYPVRAQDFIDRAVAFKPPLSPATIALRGSGAYRAGEIMQWHRDEIAQWSENYRLVASAGGGWGLTCLIMERDVLLGVAGVSRETEAGDFSQVELDRLRTLFPSLEEGFRVTSKRHREDLLGPQVAAALEEHPNCLFVFAENGNLRYANYAARLLMQNERPGISDLPMHRRSEVAGALRGALEGGAISHPAIATVRRETIDAWGPARQKAILFVVNAAPSTNLPLSPRQQEILERVIARGDLAAAAADLHISLATLRTHLRNIYRRLGASGLDEAIALYYSGG
jgi:DNA-binding CsgD family transcriptional regulator